MNTKIFYPSCHLILNETEPHIANLTIIVTTWGHFLQDENFETWLSIDSQEPEKLPVGNFSSEMVGFLGSLYSRQYNVTLSGLGEGSHFIKIRVAGGNFDCEGNVSFIVDNTVPVISSISIGNTAYFKNELELTCSTSKPVSWIAYSLDDQANVTIKTANAADNGTNEILQAKTNLTDLTVGSHTITIYANDTAGNMAASKTITFTVVPTIIATTVLIGVVVVGAVFLLVHRRQQKIKQKKNDD